MGLFELIMPRKGIRGDVDRECYQMMCNKIWGGNFVFVGRIYHVVLEVIQVAYKEHILRTLSLIYVECFKVTSTT